MTDQHTSRPSASNPKHPTGSASGTNTSAGSAKPSTTKRNTVAGYDGWAEKAQLDEKRQTIVNVGDLMGITATDEHEHSHDHAEGEKGHHHHHGATNPHLWFSPEAVLKAAEAINAAYADKAGAGSATAATAQRHFNEWNGEYADFVTLVNKARSANVQRRYVATESIISYLLEYIGAVDMTPATYTLSLIHI